MTTQDKDYAIELFRNKVLEALDDAAMEVFGSAAKSNSEGATDADLPHIFPAIDAQFERLVARYYWPLFENHIGTEKWKQNRDFLVSMGLPVIEDDAVRGQS